jgi:hypothetical protein
MLNPPNHLSRRTLLPGALLAVLVATVALFALAVVIAVGPNGPRLWLDGGDSTVNLQPRVGTQAGTAGGVTLAGRSATLLSAAPTVGDTRAADRAAAPRRAARLRSNTRVQRRSGRVPSTSRPTQPAPSGTRPTSPTTLVPAPAERTPRPAATPAPGSTVVKSHGRPKDPAPTPVAMRKQRVSATRPAPAAGAPVQQVRVSPPAPEVAKSPVHPGTPQQTGAGVVDSGLTRVPPPPGSGG